MPRKKHVAGVRISDAPEVEGCAWMGRGARTSYDEELGKVCPSHCDDVLLCARSQGRGGVGWMCRVSASVSVVKLALIFKCSAGNRKVEVVPNKLGGRSRVRQHADT